MSIAEVNQSTQGKMKKAIENLQNEFSGIRTGRANAGLVEHINVEAYGQIIRLIEIANITIPDSKTLQISVWDQNNVGAVDKAIRTSNLGLNPNIDGNLIRINLPDLTEERRNELSKLVKSKTEEAKIAIRNIRRDANEKIKNLQHDKDISEDEEKNAHDEIQKMTDDYIVKAEHVSDNKQKEIMQV